MANLKVAATSTLKVRQEHYFSFIPCKQQAGKQSEKVSGAYYSYLSPIDEGKGGQRLEGGEISQSVSQ